MADRAGANAGPAITLESDHPDTTRDLAGRLAGAAQPGDVICLWGDLGAGKTVFAKGFGAGLGIRDTISSPSFVLMGEYAGRLPMFHIDLYRLTSPEEVVDAGLLDDRRATGVVVIEWPDRLGSSIPGERLDVRIDGAADEPRRIEIEAFGEGHGRYLATISGVLE